MRLTSNQHRDLARRAHWYFDVYFGPPGDSVVFTGDGVDDLNRLISRMESNGSHNMNLKQSFLCDVGGQYSDWRPCDLQDVYAIREQYFAFYGSVSRPDEFTPGSNVAIQV